MRIAASLFAGWCTLVACGPSLDEETQLAYEALPASLDYNVDVRPILSDRCWSCHGPDANTRRAGLRLDVAADAYATTPEHGAAIDPGRRGSELVRRVLSDDPAYRMPTPESHLTLSPREKATLVKWVEDGAQYDPHWAFTPPRAGPGALSAGRVDELVREGYGSSGLAPARPAGPRELARRVYRDLTGLPPTYPQTRAFVDDPSDAHYARIVDSLLGTDAHAERLALEWLDLSRYADSHGLHADGIRTSWPWRDWVIDAFRQNKPYDEFVTEQIAGDLLPDATQEQILATAFNRNHPMTSEGGADDEEFRVQYVMDRTNTFATAFLGLTMECAACHDHKFDPVSQAEYYSLSAFFNNVKELGLTGVDWDFGPLLGLMSDSTRAAIASLDRRIGELRDAEALPGHAAGAVARQTAFIRNLPHAPRPVAYLPCDAIAGERADGYPGNTISDTIYTVPGVEGNACYLDTEYDLLHVGLEPREVYDEMSASMWVRTDKRGGSGGDQWQTLLSNAGDRSAFFRGLEFSLTPENRLNLRLVNSLPGNYVEVTSEDSVRRADWTHVGFTYDGSSEARGLQLYLDGAPTGQRIDFDALWKGIYPLVNGPTGEREARPYRIGIAGRSGTGERGILIGAVDEVKLYDRRLSHLEMAATLPTGRAVEPTPAWVDHHAAVADLRTRARKLRTLRRERLGLSGEITDVMVMREMPQPRQAYVLERGNFDQHRQAVSSGTPVSVLPFDSTRYPPNRLGLAKWLFDADNPLPARVAANRYWQLLTGRPLVSTPHDFGMQGSLPTHPALLDYLAVGFRESGWDIRALMRAIVLSDTYRLASVVDDDARAADPSNDLLARASSVRYPAELIRDYVLAVSGLLVPTVGGPSVRPYQPPGLWKEKSSFSVALLEYHPQSGDSLYRRAMYTFHRRTSPPPAMAALDQPSRERCVVARERTNTPLQALVLLNDPQFVEAARALAQRVDPRGELADTAAVDELFRRVLGRDPRAGERASLIGLYRDAIRQFADPSSGADPEELLAVGTYALPSEYDADRLGALTVAANTLFNHDEVYTRR